MRKTILERAEQAFDIICRYKSIDRQLAQRNCIGAAFYLAGIDSIERYRDPGFIEKYSRRIKRVDSVDDAIMLGAESKIMPGFIGHLMVIHPFERSKVIHRESANSQIKTESIYNALANLSALVNRYNLAYFDVE